MYLVDFLSLLPIPHAHNRHCVIPHALIVTDPCVSGVTAGVHAVRESTTALTCDVDLSDDTPALPVSIDGLAGDATCPQPTASVAAVNTEPMKRELAMTSPPSLRTAAPCGGPQDICLQ